MTKPLETFTMTRLTNVLIALAVASQPHLRREGLGWRGVGKGDMMAVTSRVTWTCSRCGVKAEGETIEYKSRVSEWFGSQIINHLPEGWSIQGDYALCPVCTIAFDAFMQVKS